jgi:hypothetical protein
MRGRTAARIAAGLSIVVMLFDVAVVLGAPWDFLTQSRIARGSPTSTGPWYPDAMYAAGAVEWAVIATAFLARTGDGPLRAAPRWLVAAIGWFATFNAAYASLTSLALPSVGWRVGWTIVNSLIFGSGLIAMIRTRPQQPPPAAPLGPRQTGNSGSASG